MILQTERLYLREMTYDDLASLGTMLKDKDVMSAWGHAFDDDEVMQWLEKQMARYDTYGFGLWAVILKETDEMIGQCGLTMQQCNDAQVLEIGYIFQKDFWHRGYAIESAEACKKYAFNVLKADEVFSIIRDNNTASQSVARRNGMEVGGKFTKHYYGMDMPHLIFSVRNKNEDKK